MKSRAATALAISSMRTITVRPVNVQSRTDANWGRKLLDQHRKDLGNIHRPAAREFEDIIRWILVQSC